MIRSGLEPQSSGGEGAAVTARLKGHLGEACHVLESLNFLHFHFLKKTNGSCRTAQVLNEVAKNKKVRCVQDSSSSTALGQYFHWDLSAYRNVAS